MAIKTINFGLDEADYAYAKRHKGSRSWRQVFLDGVEFKVYKKPTKKKRT